MSNKRIKPKEKEPTFGEQFEFNNMFRVKGKSGLVSLISHQQGSKMCTVIGIYEANTKRLEKVDNMVCLGEFEFFKLSRDKIKMSDVFTNLSNYAIKSDDYAFENITIEELMSWMVPDYDPYEFKLYNAKQVLGWYIEVTLKYSALVDEKVESGEVELLTEEEEKTK